MREFTQEGMFDKLSKVTRAVNKAKFQNMDLPKYIGGGATDCPQGLVWDEKLQSCVKPMQQMEEVLITPVTMHTARYEDQNPYADFFAKKKAEYIKRAGNFGKITNLETDFPDAQIKKIKDEYEYNRNNYVAGKLGYDYEDREKWVDKISPAARAVLQNSEYASKLQPSLWAKTNAGFRALANTLLPGQPVSYNVKGLSPKEEARYKKDKFAAFDATAFADIPGAVVFNALADSRPYAKNPGVLSGEVVNEAGEMGAGLLNPLMPIEMGTGISLAPDLVELGLDATKGALKLGKKGYNKLNDLEDLTLFSNIPELDIENIRRIYHNSERILSPEESSLLNKLGFGTRGNYINPALRNDLNQLMTDFEKISNNPVIKTDSDFMQRLSDRFSYLRNNTRDMRGVTPDDYLQTLDDISSLKTGMQNVENKFGTFWYEKPFSKERILKQYANDLNFNPYNVPRYNSVIENASRRLSRQLANNEPLSEFDENILRSIETRNRRTNDLFQFSNMLRNLDQQELLPEIYANPRLRDYVRNQELFQSPEFRLLNRSRADQIRDAINLYDNSSIINRRNNDTFLQNTYTEPVQEFSDALSELKKIDADNKYSKEIEEQLLKLNSNSIVPGTIPYFAVDQVPQYVINDISLLSTNDLKSIDEKINFITDALKSPNVKNKKVRTVLKNQLEDLYSNKWLRTDYHETMNEAGFKIPDEYKDMSMVTEGNIKYLFDSKGNLLGNITGVSKEHPYIGTTGLMPYLHGVTPAGKQSQMAKTLYRSVHHGLNNAHGIPLQTKGSFAYTELLDNGVPVRRKRAQDMWDSGVRKGWFEQFEPGKYKVIKEDGGLIDMYENNPFNISQQQRLGGNISNLHKFIR